MDVLCPPGLPDQAIRQEILRFAQNDTVVECVGAAFRRPVENGARFVKNPP